SHFLVLRYLCCTRVLLFFFLMVRPPRRSTLFPYTTLFRSKLAFTGSTRVGELVANAAAKKIIPATLELGGKSANIVFPDANWDKDRKSTRLNSSHVKISYAVFCLKKKK